MGWEYHNRARDANGRWALTGKTRQLHVRCTDSGYEIIRGRAYAREMSISQYILDLVQRDLARELYALELPADG